MQTLPDDVVEKDFERFCEKNLLDVDTSAMDEDDLKGFKKLKRTITLAIASGALMIDEDGVATYTPQVTKAKDPIVFSRPTGAALQTMDSKKKNEDVSKMYGTMAAMCGVHQKVFAQMDNFDLKVCMAVATLFLA